MHKDCESYRAIMAKHAEVGDKVAHPEKGTFSKVTEIDPHHRKPEVALKLGSTWVYVDNGSTVFVKL